MSLATRQKLRLAQSFETFAEAKERTNKDIEKRALGLKRPHDHVGNISLYTWDSEGCLAEVNSYPDDYNINYSYLARKFGVLNSKNETANNGGQIVKTFLQQNNCNIERFCNSDTNFTKIRRKKRR